MLIRDRRARAGQTAHSAGMSDRTTIGHTYVYLEDEPSRRSATRKRLSVVVANKKAGLLLPRRTKGAASAGRVTCFSAAPAWRYSSRSFAIRFVERSTKLFDEFVSHLQIGNFCLRSLACWITLQNRKVRVGTGRFTAAITASTIKQSLTARCEQNGTQSFPVPYKTCRPLTGSNRAD
jgi:hypothetical protein